MKFLRSQWDLTSMPAQERYKTVFAGAMAKHGIKMKGRLLYREVVGNDLYGV